MYAINSIDPSGGLCRIAECSSRDYAFFGIGKDFARLGVEAAVFDDYGLVAVVSPLSDDACA